MAPIDRNPWQDAYPFSSRWFDQDGVRMHYVDEHGVDKVGVDQVGGTRESDIASGTSKTLLFVHGNPTWSFHWRRLIQALRPDYRCIAVDHLGCGLSDLQPRPLRLSDHIDNLRRLIRGLDLEQITLVAQDWGGAIGLGALLAERERFERIVLLNTGAFPPPDVPWRIRVCRWPLLGKFAVQGGNVFSRAALRMTLARRQRLEPAVAAGYLAPYNNWRRRAAVYQFVRDIPMSTSHPTWRQLARIESGLVSLADWPALLVWGMQDWCFTPPCLDRFTNLWPRAEVQRIEDAGHWVLEDAEEEVVAAVSEFLLRTGAELDSSTSGERADGEATTRPSSDSTVLRVARGSQDG